MAKAKLADIIAHCNRTLKPDSFEDWPGAVNGLQVENRGSVSRIAAAVDATPATVKKAADEGAADAEESEEGDDDEEEDAEEDIDEEEDDDEEDDEEE